MLTAKSPSAKLTAAFIEGDKEMAVCVLPKLSKMYSISKFISMYGHDLLLPVKYVPSGISMMK